MELLLCEMYLIFLRCRLSIPAVDITQLVSTNHRTLFMDLSHVLKLHTQVVGSRSLCTPQNDQKDL